MLNHVDNPSIPWIPRLIKSLQLCRQSPESRYFQLATCNAEGKPSNRSLVFRTMDEIQGAIFVVSDLRTDKIADLRNNEQGAICWYFAHTREQYRFDVRGTILSLNDDGKTVATYWHNMSEPGKKQFLWGVPKSPRVHREPLKANQQSNDPPEHFCVIKFTVQRADYLCLKGNPQYRHLYEKQQGEWRTTHVIP